MKVRHLMVPGLSLEQAHRSGLTADAARFTRLVSSFPATVAVQESTLLTGAPPSAHGVLFAGDPPRSPALIEPWHDRDDTLLEGGSITGLRDRILANAESTDLLLVSGGPTGSAVRRVVEPAPVAPDGFTLQGDDLFVLCVPDRAERELPAAVADAWLNTPGIERVLAPTAESAGAWMAPADRGWILVAERGWAFRETASAFGSVEAPDAVLLAFGPSWPAAWPAGVHDWRVAPTILEVAGQDSSTCFDAPLEGARELRS